MESSADTDLIWNKVEYQKLLGFLLKEKGFSLTGLRESYLSRRVASRVYATRCSSLSDYISLIKSDECELNNLYDALTINVSSFYRNQGVFDFLKEKVFPEIIKNKTLSGDNSINIWSVGCSTGEEPYSIAILVQRNLRIRMKKFRMRVLAVDIDTRALEFAKKGIYSRSKLADLGPKIIRSCFTPVENGYQLRESLKEMVEFQQQDILKFKPVKIIFDLILCRNVMIYFSRENHFQAYKYFSSHLRNWGSLVLGKAETMFYPGKNHFELTSLENRVYRKKS